MTKAKKTKIDAKLDIAQSMLVGITLICSSLVISSFAVLIKVGLDGLRYF